MGKINTEHPAIPLPEDSIIFISGVPGVGKTTLSYELLRQNTNFRLIQETDLIREILLGYNCFLKNQLGGMAGLIENIKITDHTKLLTYEEAKQQCEIMKASITQIILRQQRKKIPTIINGVHIIPASLHDIRQNNIIFINLFVTDEQEIYKRIYGRNPTSYMLENTSLIFKTNQDLYFNTQKIAETHNNVYNINVTNIDIENAVAKINECIANFLSTGEHIC